MHPPARFWLVVLSLPAGVGALGYFFFVLVPATAVFSDDPTVRPVAGDVAQQL
ncbi:MAG: hypothetical protein V5A55_01860 [Halovenus sp.]